MMRARSFGFAVLVVACGGQTANIDGGVDSGAPCAFECPGTSACSNGACACTKSSDTVCGAGCADLQTDPLNCGACGRICYTGAPCVNGACGFCQSTGCPCPDGTFACITNANDIACTDWLSDPKSCGSCPTTCGTNEVCYQGSCTATCPTGLVSCGTTCCATAKCATRTDGTHVCGE
jgi:hypothetical protein